MKKLLLLLLCAPLLFVNCSKSDDDGLDDPNNPNNGKEINYIDDIEKHIVGKWIKEYNEELYYYYEKRIYHFKEDKTFSLIIYWEDSTQERIDTFKIGTYSVDQSKREIITRWERFDGTPWSLGDSVFTLTNKKLIVGFDDQIYYRMN
jgi:hypothetical protein